MNSLDLDSLLGQKHQYATFHDAELEALNFDFATGIIKLQFLIPCGFLPEKTLAYHRGTLEFSGLLYYFVEPTPFRLDANDRPSLWISSDGSLPAPEVDLSVELPSDLPSDAFAHYFYSSTTNSFIVIAAMHGAFHWE